MGPTLAGVLGVFSRYDAAYLNNSGSVIGGAGAAGTSSGANSGGASTNGSNGGDGISLQSSGTLVNSGVIAGGAAGAGGSATGDGLSEQNGANGAYGGIGIILSGGLVTNGGTVAGGAGGAGGAYTGAGYLVPGRYGNFYRHYSHGGNGENGGAAMRVRYGTVVNNALIEGGVGGVNGLDSFTYYFENAGNGGDGIDQAGGSIENAGLIEGGDGGSTTSRGGNGGYGIQLDIAQGAGDVVNDGTIAGGSGSSAPLAGGGGNGGGGVSLADGSILLNDGFIAGGAGGSGPQGGGGGGTGISLSNGGSVTNDGSITGGAGGYGESTGQYGSSGGGGGNAVQANGLVTVINNERITGGMGGGSKNLSGGDGGDGVALRAGGTLVNLGFVAGGNGMDAGASGGVGAALILSGALINSGTIAGGDAAAGGTGGAGAALQAYFGSTDNGTIANSGTITGGNGGAGSDYGGQGGDGVDASAGIELINTGLIAAGAGLAGSRSNGAAGDGVSLSGSGYILNQGVILGGAGADIALFGEATGIGVYLAGGTLVDSGTIAGGIDGYGTVQGTMGAAVRFGSLAALLVLDPGAVIDGAITNFGNMDTIELAGFSVASESFVAGTGLVLSNGTGTETLGIAGGLTTSDFAVTVAGGTTTITTAPNPTIVNTGTIENSSVGLSLSSGVTVFNSGVISSPKPSQGSGGTGIYGQGQNVIYNSGTIYGYSSGISLQDGGSVIDSGTIGGVALERTNPNRSPATYFYQSSAISNQSGYFTLTVDPGAAFTGSVSDRAKTGELLLAGTTAGSLDIGTSFSGFSIVEFEPGSTWTLEAGLIVNGGPFGGPAIAGFSTGDTIILEGISAATSDSFVAGKGLTLHGDIFSTAYLNIGGNFVTGDFLVTTNGTNTTVALTGANLPVFNGLITQTVTLGNGSYANNLTVANGETIAPVPPGSYAITSPQADAYVRNLGYVLASAGAKGYSNFDGMTGGGGIEAEANGTVNNAGTVIGGAGGGGAANVGNGGNGGNGGIGVDLLASAVVTNSGLVAGGYGGAGGQAGFLVGPVKGGKGGNGGAGIELGIVRAVTNDGTVAGGAGGSGGGYGLAPAPFGTTLSGGGGAGTGGQGGVGMILEGGLAVNQGLIEGGVGGGGGGATAPGSPGSSGGGGDGVDFGSAVAGGTLINAGTIAGGAGADAVYFGSYAATLVVDPGAVFVGNVVANTAASDVLVLGGTASGELAGIGGQFSGFSGIDFAAGATWSLEGDAAGLASGETILGFSAGDAIVLDGFAAGSYRFVSGSGLVLSNGGTTETIDLTGSFAAGDFVEVTDGTNTTITIDSAPCFCPGTHIRTAEGETVVEALQVGDMVVTAHAGMQRVRWIGRRAYEGRFIAGRHLMLPVTIRAGAIAEGVPGRDLVVSPGHAVFVDGLLIPAWRLVNGVSVTQADAVEWVEYVHVELDSHEILFAEGCPAESYFDDGGRGQFHNFSSAPERPLGVAKPRCEDGFGLEAARARVAVRAGIVPAETVVGALRGYLEEAGPERVVGWALDAAAPDMPVALEILCNGVRVARVLANRYRADVRAAGLGGGCHGFEVTLPVALAGRIEVSRAHDGCVLGRAAAVRQVA